MVARKSKPKVRRVIRGVAKSKEQKLKAQLLRKCPSAPWADVGIKYLPAVDEEGKGMEIADIDHRNFPPPLMPQCKGCERFTPPINIGSSGHCDDCRLGAMSRMQLSRLQGSTSTVNLAKVKAAIRRASNTTPGGI